MSGMSKVPKVRPSWDDQGHAFAEAASIRGDCTRRKVGAAIMDENHRIIGAGYNGSYPGGPSCLAGDCPRGRHYRKPGYADEECQAGATCWDSGCTGWGHPGVHTGGLCACGNAWPCPDAVAPGSSYDTGPGECVAVHAELNALLDVSDRRRLIGSTMFITEKPCDGCLKIIKNTGIVRVVWPEGEYVR